MSTPSRPRPHAWRRSIGDLLRAVGAAVLLAVLVGGVPFALYTVAGNPLPAELPTWSDVTRTLTRPAGGQLFLTVLALAGWLSWAVFTLSVLVEIPAHIRGRPAPRLPALGPAQRLAAALVTSTAAVFLGAAIPLTRETIPPAASAAPAPQGLHLVAATAFEPTDTTSHPATGSLSPGKDSRRPGDTANQRTYRVRPHDSLWDIAERTLGDGGRYRDIADLNYGRPQPGEQTLTEAHWIQPGWTLLLPPDAAAGSDHNETQDADNSNSDSAATYTVARGDTLWSIAGRQLGDGERYTALYELNRGRAQPGGDALTDPDHIEPGWVLRLPGSNGNPPPSQPEPGPRGRQTGPSDRHDGTSEQQDEAGKQQEEQQTQEPDRPAVTPSPSASPRDTASAQPPASGPPPLQPTPTPKPSATTTRHPGPPAGGDAVPQPGPEGNGHRSPGDAGDEDSRRVSDHEQNPDAAGEDAAALPVGMWAGPLLAAGVAAVAEIVRRRRRRSYQPQPPAPGVATTPPVWPETVRTLLEAATAPGPHPVDTGHPGLVELGTGPDGAARIDLGDLDGLVADGPGAEPLARAVLATVCAQGAPHDVDIVLAGAGSRQRLLPGSHDLPGVRETPSWEQALSELETESLARARTLDQAGVDTHTQLHREHPDDADPLLVLAGAGVPPEVAQQLAGALAAGRTCGITAVLTAPTDVAETLRESGTAGTHVDASGRSAHTSPDHLAYALNGATACRLTADETTQITALLTEARRESDVPPPPDVAGADAPEPFDSDDVTGAAAIHAAAPTNAPDDTSIEWPEPGHGEEAGPLIYVRVLGPIQIRVGDTEITTGLRSNARELLAYSVLHPDGTTIEAATETLWPYLDTGRARKRWRNALTSLRSTLRGPSGKADLDVLVKDGDRYRIQTGILDVDLWQFQRGLTDAAHADTDHEEIAALTRAADAYGGDFAADTDYLWAETSREDLRRRCLDTLVRLAQLHHDHDADQHTVACLEQAIDLDPAGEEAYRRLIRLHGEHGRLDAARRVYRKLADHLDDLDLAPSTETRALMQELTKGTGPTRRRAAAPETDREGHAQ